jgi:hypothetical protein
MDHHRDFIYPAAARFFGRNISPRFPRTGNWIHILIVIVVILIILHLLGMV